MAQYTGAKAVLRPIFDALAAELRALGADVRIEGRSTYVPFVRGRQFAAVASATAKRVDVGLRITDAAESSRLSSAKAPGQATHKVSLTAVGQVDAELIGLIRRAYEQSP